MADRTYRSRINSCGIQCLHNKAAAVQSMIRISGSSDNIWIAKILVRCTDHRLDTVTARTCRIGLQRTCICSKMIPCRLGISHLFPGCQIDHTCRRKTVPSLIIPYSVDGRGIHDCPSSGKSKFSLYIPDFQAHVSSAQIISAAA